MGYGTIVERTLLVHMNKLLNNEVKIMIHEVEEGMETHPNYTIEAGSFVAWAANSCTYHDL